MGSTKSLLEEIEEVKASRVQGPVCSIRKLLDELPEDEATELSQIMADPSVLSTHITKALKNRDHLIGDHVMQRHRRGGCSCGEDLT